MGIGKTYVNSIETESERKEEEEEEKEKSLSHHFDFGRKKEKKTSPNNLAHVSLEKMRAAKNGYNTP